MIDFGGRRILCLGDVMLDRFHYGRIDRISPEAPVPVVRMADSRAMLGGAGNVARNIASLGGEAVLVGVVGQDAAGRELAGLIAGTPGLTDATVASATRPTIAKTRIIAGHQHVVRLDEEVTGPITDADAAAIRARVEALLPGCHALVLSDYAKGLLRADVVRHAIDAARRLGLPVLVDPKRSDFGFYAGATVLTPNLKELRAAAQGPADTEEELAAAARALLGPARADAILVTRSEKGMLLVEAEGGTHTVRAHAKEVFDVSGAGDTVIAVMALAVAAGFPLPRAMRIANAAAGVVVGKLGTATLDMGELTAAMDAETPEPADIAGKIVSSAEQAIPVLDAWRRRGLEIGFTNGCFDILHRGHVTMLQAARAACDRLVVALNTDDSVRRLKGDGRPVNALEDRLAVIAALQSVDLVLAFGEDTPLELITRLQPDVLFKGADYRPEEVVGGDVVQARGGRVALIDLVPGRSTTGIIARSRAGAG
ncbi:D-beta-D-heptose 7-phosphate kinase / D-beta-D-heptose 1-phosphate adenosyltransferase [Roseomonas rosea]|uniref:Bifunctional protein HldE n=1 Tax=Muricoccus roseus TaxID=198092 RepID=A0A1M6DFC1_9PROT|nr:bifunctional D-glycero-beta-D-manno-heptose-7-phosphate kinase/D-glycero-beta-D-manno-heptose 1-phosphate adenylyltransferase HldE [Roseomonas rosea]SHI71860.1 D-beta-D-heptose 7-phosphate kinase / D-beta-D-heptose 1-phosphate adenosyltransferase [Roseomonas rosea]